MVGCSTVNNVYFIKGQCNSVYFIIYIYVYRKMLSYLPTIQDLNHLIYMMRSKPLNDDINKWDYDVINMIKKIYT